MNMHKNAKQTPLGRERMIKMMLDGRCDLSTGYVFEPDRRDWHCQTTTLYERRFK